MRAVRDRRRRTRGRAAAGVSDTLRLFAQTRERMARLSDELRLALALVVVEGLSYDEAADRLNIPKAILQLRLEQAREALRSMIANESRPRALAAE